jgi:hypothetical protein
MISSCGANALFLACFISQLESFLQLLGSQEKRFFSGFHNRQVEQGISASLPIFHRGYLKL